MERNTNPHVTGLEQFGLNHASFRLLGNRDVQAYIYLGTYDVTPEVRRLHPSKRFAYLLRRVGRWVKGLRRSFPKLSFELIQGKASRTNVQLGSQLPATMQVSCSAREIFEIAKAAGVHSVHVSKVAGLRRRLSNKLPLEWYCVRALVVIRVEGATSGMQSLEDRFMLLRASSFEDAEKRLNRQWREYAIPYLNSDGQLVSWQFDHVTDVYSTSEYAIDPTGTEVYSKLSSRRMRPEFVWKLGAKKRSIKAKRLHSDPPEY